MVIHTAKSVRANCAYPWHHFFLHPQFTESMAGRKRKNGAKPPSPGHAVATRTSNRKGQKHNIQPAVDVPNFDHDQQEWDTLRHEIIEQRDKCLEDGGKETAQDGKMVENSGPGTAKEEEGDTCDSTGETEDDEEDFGSFAAVATKSDNYEEDELIDTSEEEIVEPPAKRQKSAAKTATGTKKNTPAPKRASSAQKTTKNKPVTSNDDEEGPIREFF
jgi:hypothetical protein